MVLLLPTCVIGQLQNKQKPSSSLLKGLTFRTSALILKKVNVDSLEKSETKNSTPRPWKFGENIKVNLSLDNSGTWTKVSGGKIWQLEVVSQGALTLNFIFEKFKIPVGGKLFIYNKLDSLGAFNDRNNQKDGKFATTLVRGDRVMIEYYEPDFAEFKTELILSEVIHGFRDVFKMAKAFGSSGSCNNNVNCSVGTGWEDQKKSVVMLVVGGSGFCTGSVINNTASNNKPYVLTADHCYSGNESTWIFWFNWESATCTNPSSSPSYSSLSGSTLRARNAPSDFCLVEINASIPNSYNPYYVGWSRSTAASTSGASIHHPSGDIKKVSFYNTSLVPASWGGSATLNHWQANWSNGITEPGSSGSALYDSNKRLVGQLHGGPSYCGAPAGSLNDVYGMFHVSWDGGGTATTRLKDWLDPNNSSVSTLDGVPGCGLVASLSPNASSSYCSTDPPVVLTVTSTETLTYQWKRNGVNVGTNSPTYSAVSVGAYTVALTSATCSTTLGPVNLTTPVFSPIITSSNLKFCPTSAGNQQSVLRASGVPTPATYQWRQNGSNIPLATADTLLVTGAGNYTLVATKCGGSAMSPAVTVTSPSKAPVLIPIDKTVCNFTTSPVPNYTMTGTPQCGINYATTLSYSGPEVGYDAGNISGINPTIEGASLGMVKSLKLSITWRKKSGGTAPSCGLADNGGTPYSDEVSFRLQSPNGTIIPLLLSNTYLLGTGTTSQTIILVFSDSAATFIPQPSLAVSGTFKPSTALSAFNGQNPNGTWTLLPNDSGSGDPLCVSGFSMTFYTDINTRWYAQANGTGFLQSSLNYSYTPLTFNEGLNTYYASTDCSVYCPSDLVPIKLTVDCNCANSSDLSLIGDMTLTKQTQNTITSLAPNTISVTKKVEYKAGKSIVLNPGFSTKPEDGGLFKAQIEGCN